MKGLLPDGCFPKPTGEELQDFLRWDDWRILGLLADGRGGEHGARLATRNHFKLAYPTPEVCAEKDLERLESIRNALGGLLAAEETAASSWYKTGPPDIPVIDSSNQVAPLSAYSTVIASMKSNNQVLLYVRPEDRPKAKELIDRVPA